MNLVEGNYTSQYVKYYGDYTAAVFMPCMTMVDWW